MNVFCIRPKGLNIGNDVIYIGMKYFLENALGYHPNIITLPATTRYETSQRAGLTAATIYEINQYGHGVIVGGGNLYENNELDMDLNALQALEVPLFTFSLSRGRVYNRRNKLVDRTDRMPDEKILALNRTAAMSSVRDEATQKYLTDIGCRDVSLSACPTMFVDRIAASLPEISERQQNLTLVSVRQPSLMNIPLSRQAQVRQDVREIVDFLKSEGHKPVLFCHDQRDIPFAASFPGLDYIYVEDVLKYLAILKSCWLNVSYRLHSVLPCLAYGAPVIAISYDERGLSLLETVGYGDWNIDMMAADSIKDAVAARFGDLASLPARRKANTGAWNGFYDTISGLFATFAEKMRAAEVNN